MPGRKLRDRAHLLIIGGSAALRAREVTPDFDVTVFLAD